ncbi:MAG: PH domain-containing protein [Candidatus Peribacteraceae bacterium]|nr:PH domain-containing protein [Candidatus Peribacteraceae bacterium]
MDKIREKFCQGENECEVLSTHFHGISFLMAIIREMLILFSMICLVIVAMYFGWPMQWPLSIAGFVILILVIPSMLKSYIDWKYDFIIVTTDKVILIDQTSFFRNEIKPIQYDNVGGVSTRTQWLGLFSFGEVRIALKEGEGGTDVIRRFVPHANDVAGKITEMVTKYQRRRVNQSIQNNNL